MPEPELTRIPPQSNEAEMAVLGSMLTDAAAADAVFSKIKSADVFYREAHKSIFTAANNLRARNVEIDLLTVSNELEKINKLEACGGHFYITELAESIPSAANVAHYCDIMLEYAMHRLLIHVGRELETLGFDTSINSTELIQQAEQKIYSLNESGANRGFVSMGESMHQTLEALEKRYLAGGEIIGIPTGFKELDVMLSGIQRKEMTLIAARPSQGKTALCKDMARNAALRGHRVGIFSLETTHENLTMRELASQSQINLGKLRNGKIHEREWQKVSRTAGTIAQLPIWYQDEGNLNVMELRSMGRVLKREQDVDLIFVDYIQLLSAGPAFKTDNRNRELEIISQQLHFMAKELDVAVVALSQLSRSVTSREGHEPTLSDLRDSGALEQEAYVVIFIDRPEQWGDETVKINGVDYDSEDWAKLIVAKQKDGVTGHVWVRFQKKYVRFMDQDEYRSENVPSFLDQQAGF